MNDKIEWQLHFFLEDNDGGAQDIIEDTTTTITLSRGIIVS